MAYNNINVLKRMIAVQNIVLEQKKKGVTQVFVFNNMIRDTYLISWATFNRWLAYPAKQELKRKCPPGPKTDERQLSFQF